MEECKYKIPNFSMEIFFIPLAMRDI